jgi:hypothetical protein
VWGLAAIVDKASIWYSKGNKKCFKTQKFTLLNNFAKAKLRFKGSINSRMNKLVKIIIK